MKKAVITILFSMMMMGVTACGAGTSAKTESAVMNSASSTGMSKDSAWLDSSSGFVKEDVKVEYDMLEEGLDSGGSFGENVQGTTIERKVIKTARLNLQTLDFDGFVQALDQKMIEAGAYLQYADVYGSASSNSRRSAEYTIRVPERALDSFLAGMEGIATVTSKTLGEEDVTLNYTDMENRIKTLEIEQERLLALLEKAEDLESIILLEERLSEVRYRIENYQSSLRTYDDKITYSTVRISVYEVTRVTEKAPKTVGERIQSGLENTMYDISEGAKDLFVWVIVNIPYLVFWVAVLSVVILIIKKKRAKRLQKKIGKQNKNNETELDNKE